MTNYLQATKSNILLSLLPSFHVENVRHIVFIQGISLINNNNAISAASSCRQHRENEMYLIQFIFSKQIKFCINEHLQLLDYIHSLK
jgi:hypothetical protein